MHINIYEHLPKVAQKIRETVFIKEQGLHNDFAEIDPYAKEYRGKNIGTSLQNPHQHYAQNHTFQYNKDHQTQQMIAKISSFLSYNLFILFLLYC